MGVGGLSQRRTDGEAHVGPEKKSDNLKKLGVALNKLYRKLKRLYYGTLVSSKYGQKSQSSSFLYDEAIPLLTACVSEACDT